MAKDNRSKAIALLWRQSEGDTDFSSRYQHFLNKLDSSVAARQPAWLGLDSLHLFNRFLDLAAATSRNDAQKSNEAVRKAFAFFYWGAELLLHCQAAEKWNYEPRDDAFVELLWFHGIAGQGKAHAIADWVAPHLYNYLVKGPIADLLLELKVDPHFCNFIRILLSAQIANQWPAQIDQASLGGFGEILLTAGSEQDFPAALINYCDFRMAQCLRYQSIEVPKRRSAAVTKSAFDARQSWLGVLPAELFILKYAFEKTTGRALSLSADHPLLQSPLMNMPDLLPLHEDQDTRRLRDFGANFYGNSWKPLSPITPRS
jgi:hypothetical protein